MQQLNETCGENGDKIALNVDNCANTSCQFNCSNFANLMKYCKPIKTIKTFLF